MGCHRITGCHRNTRGTGTQEDNFLELVPPFTVRFRVARLVRYFYLLPFGRSKVVLWFHIVSSLSR